MILTLSVDHRVADSTIGAEFAAVLLVKLMEHPLRISL